MRFGIFSIMVLVLLSACGGASEDQIANSGKFTVSMDTVLVDAGEDFLFLQYDLFTSALSADKSYLININPESLAAERIDLNKLELTKKIQFEKEGPNGVGPYLASFSLRENGQLLFQNYLSYKIFGQDGTLKEDLELEKIAKEYLGDTEAYPVKVYEPEDDRILVLTLKWQDYSYRLVDIDMKSKTYEVIDLDYFEKLKDFRTSILYEGNPAGGFGPSVRASLHQGHILMSTDAFNEVVIFDLETDSLSVKSWDTPILGAKRTYSPPKEMEMTSGEMKEVRRKVDEDISFSPFMWDEVGRRYLRFSQKKVLGEELDEFDEYISTGATVFLSAFDSDFNLLNEAELPELKDLPYIHFVKDGRVWLYENIEDELAFIRLKIE